MSSPPMIAPVLMGALMALFLNGCSEAMSTGRPAVQPPGPQFDYLLLAHFWPPVSCYIYEGDKCRGIPKGVNGFTLHGFWPSIYDEMKPLYCDNSSRFDYNQIASLGDKLSVEWPGYNDEDQQGLWEHEWTKHGTCATSLPKLRGEFNYFSTTLKVHESLDLFGALEKWSIVPSDSVLYSPQEFFQAIQAELKIMPRILCYYSHKYKTLYLEQIYLCYNKELVLVNCMDEFFIECPDKDEKSLRFLPIESTDGTEGRSNENVLIFESEWKEEVVRISG